MKNLISIAESHGPHRVGAPPKHRNDSGRSAEVIVFNCVAVSVLSTDVDAAGDFRKKCFTFSGEWYKIPVR